MKKKLFNVVVFKDLQILTLHTNGFSKVTLLVFENVVASSRVFIS